MSLDDTGCDSAGSLGIAPDGGYMLPFWYPTSVWVVDDQRSMLAGFSFTFPDRFPYRLFINPHRAVTEALEDHASRKSVYDTAIEVDIEESQGSPKESVSIDRSAIVRAVSDPDRFSEPSCLILDYGMPQMTGLDLLKRIEHVPARRILYTGHGTERERDPLALGAFNNGLINRYLVKGNIEGLSDEEAAEAIFGVIDEMQFEYMATRLEYIQRTLSLVIPKFHSDPNFVAAFRQILDQHKAIEYYFLEGPPGFLLLDEAGAARRLVVLDERAMGEWAAKAELGGAPRDVLEGLQSRSLMPMATPALTVSHFTESMWRGIFTKPKVIEGVSTYYLGMGSAEDLLSGTAVASFGDYLNLQTGEIES